MVMDTLDFENNFVDAQWIFYFLRYLFVTLIAIEYHYYFIIYLFHIWKKYFKNTKKYRRKHMMLIY